MKLNTSAELVLPLLRKIWITLESLLQSQVFPNNCPPQLEGHRKLLLHSSKTISSIIPTKTNELDPLMEISIVALPPLQLIGGKTKMPSFSKDFIKEGTPRL